MELARTNDISSLEKKTKNLTGFKGKIQCGTVQYTGQNSLHMKTVGLSALLCVCEICNCELKRVMCLCVYVCVCLCMSMFERARYR